MQTGVEKIVDFDLAEVFTEDFDSRRNPAQSIAIRPSDVLSSHNIALPSENAALSDCFDLSSLNIETLGSCAFSARDIALRDCVDLPSRDIVLSNSVDFAQQDDIAPESVDFSPCKGSTLVYILAQTTILLMKLLYRDCWSKIYPAPMKFLVMSGILALRVKISLSMKGEIQDHW